MATVPTTIRERERKISFWAFFRRAMRLRCPECGMSRIFKPWRQTRTLEDWVRPLHDCPNCEYEYQREEGYFMMAICAVNYGVITAGAIVVAFLLYTFVSPPLWVYIVFIFVPMPLLSFLFTRHAKALWMAIDHYLEPQAKRQDRRA